MENGRFDIILWDVDGTLLNFEAAEKQAINKCFDIFGIGECSDDMLARYSSINTKYWKKLERNEITKPQVLIGRFEEFFASEGIQCTDVLSFNDTYQEQLGETIVFNDNAYELIEYLSKHVKQYVVTNGTAVAQRRKLDKSGLGKLFNDVFISEIIGIEKPNIGFFNKVFEVIGECDRDRVLIVGDSLTSDMRGGINAGIKTCWYAPNGEICPEGYGIDYTIRNLNKIKSIF